MALNQYKSISEIKKQSRVAVLGHFDGLHLGHQYLLAKGRQIARKKNIPLLVFTFYPQFQSLLDPNFKYIMSQEAKMEMLSELGVDEVVILPFTKDFSQCSPDEFVQNYITKLLTPEDIIVGFDYSFGYKGEGKAEDLARLVENANVHILEPYLFAGETISSTLIREALRDGNINRAECALGYTYHLTGKIIHGLSNGRKFLVPTANIELSSDLLLPKVGVYAANCKILSYENNIERQAVLNIGTRPTVDNDPKEIVEAHILDFDEDIYGHTLRVYNLHYLRGIVKYDGFDSLKQAILRDIQQAKGILNPKVSSIKKTST